MRAFVVGVAGAAAVVAALAAALLWTGRDLLDDRRFADDAIVALRAPEGRGALAVRVRAAIDDARGSGGATVVAVDDASVDAVVGRVTRRPAFAPALAPALALAHRRLLRLSGEPVTVDLAALRDLVAGELGRIDPRLAALLPDAGAVEDVRLSTGVEVPGVPGARLADRAPAITILLAVVAVALAGVAIALADRSRRATAWIGAALLLAAAAPAAARYLVPAEAGSRVAPPDDALAERLAAELLSGWVAAAAALAGAGLVLLVSASVGRSSRPRRPRRAG